MIASLIILSKIWSKIWRFCYKTPTFALYFNALFLFWLNLSNYQFEIAKFFQTVLRKDDEKLKKNHVLEDFETKSVYKNFPQIYFLLLCRCIQKEFHNIQISAKIRVSKFKILVLFKVFIYFFTNFLLRF